MSENMVLFIATIVVLAMFALAAHKRNIERFSGLKNQSLFIDIRETGYEQQSV